MTQSEMIQAGRQLSITDSIVVPTVIAGAGRKAKRRFVEFFTANIRNSNTRAAYARALSRFCTWCDDRGLALQAIEPTVVAAYIEELMGLVSVPTVKQHLAAIRMVMDWLVTGGVLSYNPAAAVRGPKYVVATGKTPVLSPEEARQLLDSIDVRTIVGLRDRALIGVMVFSFARVTAAIGMDVRDYFPKAKRFWFRLHEKGGKYHEVPAHHNAEHYMDEYLAASGFGGDKRHPLFPTADRHRLLTSVRLDRNAAWYMIKRRARQAGLS